MQNSVMISNLIVNSQGQRSSEIVFYALLVCGHILFNKGLHQFAFSTYSIAN